MTGPGWAFGAVAAASLGLAVWALLTPAARPEEPQPLRIAAVVKVLARDVFAACLSHAVVIRRRGAETAGSEDANPPILSRNLLKS